MDGLCCVSYIQGRGNVPFSHVLDGWIKIDLSEQGELVSSKRVVVVDVVCLNPSRERLGHCYKSALLLSYYCVVASSA